MMQQPPPGSAGNKDVFSPRKKKGQITFAQSSFLSSLEIGSLEDSNKKVAEDVQFLYSQLQRTRKDRDVAMERCEALEAQLQSTQKHFKEASSRRQLEEEVFRRQLVTAKSEFDKKLVKLALKAKDREDMLVDWISAIADHKLEQQHEHLVELLERTVALLPPTLREMMRRNKNISQTTTGRTTKTKKGVRSKQPRKGQAKSSITSADPDALLAIINENISVLDNFNLKHLSSFNADGSDTENLIQGGYQDYLNSSNDERDEAHQVAIAHAINAQSKGHHYSGLSTQAKTCSSDGAPEDAYHINEHYVPGSSPQSRAYTAQSTASSQAARRSIGTAGTAGSRDTRSRGSPKNSSRKGARTRKRVKTPSGRDGRERNEDSDSGESGTVTGSIMDHDVATSDEEGGLAAGRMVQYVPQQYGISEEDQQQEDARLEAALYDMSLSKSLSLTAPEPSGAHNMTDLYGASEQAYYSKPPFASGVPSNSRTPRSTEMGYGEAAHFAHDTSDTHATHPYGNVRNTFEERSEQADSEVAGSEDAGGVGGDQFIETMRNLQEIVGQRPVSGGGASDKRKMSEMTANYTDMVRNILDSMSELSKSVVPGEGSDVDGGGSGIGREIAAMAGITDADRSPPKPSSRGKQGSPEKGSSAAQVPHTSHVHGLDAPIPSSIEALLVQAGVSLDAISNLSDDAQYVHNDYPDDGNKADHTTRGSYTEVDIAQMIASSQLAIGNSSVENSDAEGAHVRSAEPVDQKAASTITKGKGKKKKKVTKGGKKGKGSDSESEMEVLSLGANSAGAVAATAVGAGSKTQAAAGNVKAVSSAAPVRSNASMMAAGARALSGGSVHSQTSQLSQSVAPAGAGNRSAYGESGDYSMNFDSIQQSKSKSGAVSGNVSAGNSLASKPRMRVGEDDSQYLKLGGDWDSHSESSQQPGARHGAGNTGSYSNYSSYSNNQQYASKR